VEEHGLSAEGQARRRFLKQAGTVAWATPFIVTMMSRTAHAQGTVCGEQAGTPGSFFCNVTTPCGSTEQCIPNPLDPGGDCVCQAVPNPEP
jgi:hypothetical protein